MPSDTAYQYPGKSHRIWRLFAFAIFSILAPLLVLTSYATKLFRNLVNAWLLINSTNIFFGIFGLPEFPRWLDDLTESLREFLSFFYLGFMADWWNALSNVFLDIETYIFSLFEGMQVTCEGSQMPLVACSNFALIFFAVILIESNFDLVLIIRMKKFINDKKKLKREPLGWLKAKCKLSSLQIMA